MTEGVRREENDGPTPAIGGYSFGQIEIGGERFTADVLVFPDGRVKGAWWRQSGHVLCLADIRELIESGPATIVAGTGASGQMRPAPGLEEDLKNRGIVLEAMPTEKACRRYNELRTRAPIGACLHLTC